MSMVRVHPRLPVLLCGRRSTDQDTRLRTGRHGGSNPPARAISGSSSKGEGAALRRLKFRFKSGRADHFTERRPTGEVPGCRPGLDEFDSRTLRQFIAAMWTSWFKSPALQAGYRGFESRHRYHWPEAHQDEQAILNRQAASSILARPTNFL